MVLVVMTTISKGVISLTAAVRSHVVSEISALIVLLRKGGSGLLYVGPYTACL